MADTWKNVICIGSGNEGNSAGHVRGTLADDLSENIELAVQERQGAFSVQVWKSFVDEVDIEVISPFGEGTGLFQTSPSAARYEFGRTRLLVYYGEPKPYSVRQEIYISFLPAGDSGYVDSGVWRIILTPKRVVDGLYQIWLPAQAALNIGTAFLQPSAVTTLTIPSTSSRAITVGAYDAATFSYADFSGRGPSGACEGNGFPKPDLAAPGVGVYAPVPGGGYRQVSGTSFSTPFVTGAAALLMEWGIVLGEDPYLYGEKVKAYLRRGARELSGYDQWPNIQLGYGALCVRDSFPE